MRIGVPKEIKVHEYRVGLVPSSVHELVYDGHEVVVEKGAGAEAGIPDEAYKVVGARIAETADEVFAFAEMLVKVKEPQPAERKKLRPGQVLFTYLHLAPDPGADPRSAAKRRDLHRLRDSDRAGRFLAAADADVRSCRPHGAAGGRVLSGERAWRARHFAGRRAGRAAGGHSDSGGRRGGLEHGVDRRGHGGKRNRCGSIDGCAAPNRRAFRFFGRNGFLDAERRRAAGAQSGSGDWRGAGGGRCGAKTADGGNGQEHEAGRGAGGHCHRPRGLLGDQPSDDACRSHVTCSTTWSTTASRTCPGPCREPLRSR